MTDTQHWESVYGSKAPDTVSWYRPHLERSTAWIDACRLASDARIVDVGGGASTLVDDLLARGFVDVTVVDLSAAALAIAQSRLGAAADTVRWVAGDATAQLFEPKSIDFWHDRAVFHFLVDPGRRDGYLASMRGSVRPGGFAMISTFAPNGPERCSGLPVARYAPSAIAEAAGASFTMVDQAEEIHTTPGGATQAFASVLLRRTTA